MISRALEEFAAAERINVERLVVDRLRAVVPRPTSPEALLRTIQELPHPSVSAVDDLDAEISSGRSPVRHHGVFDT
jgi:hypothetical protein